ncbi:hypothetical protein N234_10450 [Ralstonia pickettii DTP0602]|nr:hypothetical protein N234_10450 [Ralstonia pickettii DTP0602]
MDQALGNEIHRLDAASHRRMYSTGVQLPARRHSRILVDLIVGCPIIQVLTETRFSKAKVGQ